MLSELNNEVGEIYRRHRQAQPQYSMNHVKSYVAVLTLNDPFIYVFAPSLQYLSIQREYPIPQG